MVFVAITLVNLIFNLFVGFIDLKNRRGIKYIINDSNGIMDNMEAVMEMRWIFDYQMNDLISILIMIVSAFFTIPVFYVLFIQLKGMFIKENNYN